jgi:hypothetical protein
LQPDLILLTGDYINADCRAWGPRDAASLLAQLSALMASAVTGNVDTDFVQEFSTICPSTCRMRWFRSMWRYPLCLVGISNRR